MSEKIPLANIIYQKTDPTNMGSYCINLRILMMNE
jgi:hypothetical protein